MIVIFFIVICKEDVDVSTLLLIVKMGVVSYIIILIINLMYIVVIIILPNLLNVLVIVTVADFMFHLIKITKDGTVNVEVTIKVEVDDVTILVLNKET